MNRQTLANIRPAATGRRDGFKCLTLFALSVLSSWFWSSSQCERIHHGIDFVPDARIAKRPGNEPMSQFIGNINHQPPSCILSESRADNQWTNGSTCLCLLYCMCILRYVWRVCLASAHHVPPNAHFVLYCIWHLLSSGAGGLACLRCSQACTNHEGYGSGPEGL